MKTLVILLFSFGIASSQVATPPITVADINKAVQDAVQQERLVESVRDSTKDREWKFWIMLGGIISTLATIISNRQTAKFRHEEAMKGIKNVQSDIEEVKVDVVSTNVSVEEAVNSAKAAEVESKQYRDNETVQHQLILNVQAEHGRQLHIVKTYIDGDKTMDMQSGLVHYKKTLHFLVQLNELRDQQGKMPDPEAAVEVELVKHRILDLEGRLGLRHEEELQILHESAKVSSVV